MAIVVFLLIAFLYIIFLAVAAFSFICLWKIFKKAGEAPWKIFIPVYNQIVLYKISGLSPYFVIFNIAYMVFYPIYTLMISINLNVLSIIPFAFFASVASIGMGVMSIIQDVKLGKAFNKSAGFIVGMVFLNPIFYGILAFDKSEYALNKQEEPKEVVVESVPEKVKEVTEATEENKKEE